MSVDIKTKNALELIAIGTLLQLLISQAMADSFVPGPYIGRTVPVVKTDVRELGCADCWPTPRILAVVDFNNDGTDEIVLSMDAADSELLSTNVPLPILFYSLDGKPYSGISDRPKRVLAREAVVADFNGDGILDLFIAAAGLDIPPYPGEQNVLFLSQPDGNHTDVSSSHLPQMSDFAHGGAAADIDGDGDVDLMVITNGSGGTARVPNYFLLNSGDGTFIFSEGRNHLPKGLPRKVNTFLTARFADMNNDGVLDLLMAGEGKNGAQSRIIYGTGTGKFTDTVELPRSTYGKKTHTTDIDVVDLNADGLQDLVLSNSTQVNGVDFRGIQIQILIQRSDGSFQDETNQRSWDQFGQKADYLLFPENTMMVDLNDDTHLDAVIQSFNPIWRNRPDDTPAHIALNDGLGNFKAVEPQWLSRQGWVWWEILPLQIKGKTRLVGMTLDGVGEEYGEFRPIGHSVYLFE